MTNSIKELRYQVMLALYLPILLYSFSTFDFDSDVVAFDAEPVVVEGQVEDVGEATTLGDTLGAPGAEDVGEAIPADSLASTGR